VRKEKMKKYDGNHGQPDDRNAKRRSPSAQSWVVAHSYDTWED